MTAVNLKLKGMSCASCANNIERAILNVPGVIDGSVNFSSDRAAVNYDPQQTDTNIICQAVAAVGDEAQIIPANLDRVDDEADNREQQLATRDRQRRVAIDGQLQAAIAIADTVKPTCANGSIYFGHLVIMC